MLAVKKTKWEITVVTLVDKEQKEEKKNQLKYN